MPKNAQKSLKKDYFRLCFTLDLQSPIWYNKSTAKVKNGQLQGDTFILYER